MNNSSELKRKLAAIVFTDIAGFTELSSQDERKAFALLEKQRDILKPIVEAYEGEWLKEIGDGLLLTFPTVSGAVECSIKIQESVKSLPDLNLRVGVHEGEITVKGNDVFGDDVNIASRIEPFAAEGGIAISGKVQQNLSSLPEFETKFIGQPALKGVKQEVKIYCITSHGLPETDIIKVNAKLEKPKKKNLFKSVIFPATGILFTIIGIAVWFIYPFLTLTIAQDRVYDRKIAILYFENRGNPDEVYYSDGLSEEIMNRLTKIENLSVVPSFEVKKYQNMDIDLKQINKDLSPDFVLYGNVIKAPEKIRISVELINLNSMDKVWGQSYQKNSSEIFNIQDNIVENLIVELGIDVNETDRLQAISNPTDNLSAYELLLKAKTESYTIVNDYDKILDMIKRIKNIINQDPEYADALSILSAYKAMLFNYYFLSMDGYYTFEEGQKIIDESIELAERSIKSDAENELALSMLPMAISMRLFVTESTAKKMLYGRRIITELNNLANYYPNGYLTKFAFGNFYNIKSGFPIVSKESDKELGIKYLSDSSEIIEKMISQNSSDPKIYVTYERAVRQLSGMYFSLFKFEKSRKYIDKQVTFFNKQSRPDKLILAYNDRARIENFVGNFYKSIDDYLAVEKNAKLDSNFYEQILSNINIARNFIDLNQIDVGFELLNESYNLINSTFKKELLPEISFYKLLFKYYESLAYIEFKRNNIKLAESHALLSIENMDLYINSGKFSNSTQNRLISNILFCKIIIAHCRIKENDKDIGNQLISEILKNIQDVGIPKRKNREINYRLAQVYKDLNDQENYIDYIEKAYKQLNFLLDEIDNSDDITSFRENVIINREIINEIKVLN